ncbi:Similar to Retrovirus-related Pol polyprotein from transposon TNT 1-94; acc. no. P10978 [Pyronema omphalodes CBS 100304]|uniref:Similar to Retrovirus-related Pol polyprotein from transposon TNT 1-94 acc. no. P10978 n=1 Tax=Pyronema omphalodes (strain CBS 100304) TaxID=1076935 RepID=U4L0Z6_PYROM|nr:Similar to Retrovirus-related Pol polyprotein from transposon TNT 1-94; acc. no. P10978 [Pyronema omphalodes CBS 100304]
MGHAPAPDVYEAQTSTVVAAYKQYLTEIERLGKVTNSDFSILRFRCDNDRGAFDNTEFRDLCTAHGTAIEFTPPYTQDKNGVAERLIGVIVQRARAMLIDAQAPVEFWAEAVNTAVYIHQRIPSKALSSKPDSDGLTESPSITPYDMLHMWGKKVYEITEKPLDNLHRFGCVAYKMIPEEQRLNKKFGERSRRCMMGGG